MRATALILGLLALAGCESSAPMTRTGMALDHAGTVTADTVADGAHATGNALDRSGTYVKDKVGNP